MRIKAPNIIFSQNPEVRIQTHNWIGMECSQAEKPKPPKGWRWWFSYQDQGSHEAIHLFYTKNNPTKGQPITIMIELESGFELLQKIFPSSKKYIALPWIHEAHNSFEHVNEHIFRIWKETVIAEHYPGLEKKIKAQFDTPYHLKMAFENAYGIVGDNRGLIPAHLTTVLEAMKRKSKVLE